MSIIGNGYLVALTIVALNKVANTRGSICNDNCFHYLALIVGERYHYDNENYYQLGGVMLPLIITVLFAVALGVKLKLTPRWIAAAVATLIVAFLFQPQNALPALVTLFVLAPLFNYLKHHLRIERAFMGSIAAICLVITVMNGPIL